MPRASASPPRQSGRHASAFPACSARACPQLAHAACACAWMRIAAASLGQINPSARLALAVCHATPPSPNAFLTAGVASELAPQDGDLLRGGGEGEPVSVSLRPASALSCARQQLRWRATAATVCCCWRECLSKLAWGCGLRAHRAVGRFFLARLQDRAVLSNRRLLTRARTTPVRAPSGGFFDIFEQFEGLLTTPAP